MKSLNDAEILAVLAAKPKVGRVQSTRSPEGKELRLHFPVAWTRDGVTSLIVVTAIGKSAREIEQSVLPGEPLFLTGNLSKFEGAIRFKMISSARPGLDTSAMQTIEVNGQNGPLLSLVGGHCDVHLRGHIHEDCNVKNGRYHSLLMVREKEGSYAERYEIVTQTPVFGGQGVSVRGEYTRYTNEPEQSGMIVADRLMVTERLLTSANLSNRDPQDRMRLHRLAQGERDALPSGVIEGVLEQIESVAH